MWRLVIWSLVAGAVLGPASAEASTPVTLSAPRDGAVLASGQMATIAWQTEAGGFSALGAPVEEWEAFLSVDGGRSYPFRVTPHLDIDLASVRFEVPAVRSDDVRLLLRFGNEAREVGFEMPQRFSIAAPSTLSATPGPAMPIAPSAAQGEAARPGDPGVRVWVEGDRRGRDLRLRVASHPLRIDAPSLAAGFPSPLPTLPPKRDAPRLGEASSTGVRVLSSATAATFTSRAGRAQPILLLIHRSNR